MSNARLIEVFKSIDDEQWYYHAKAANGEIVANSEAYKSKSNALRAAEDTFPDTQIEVIST
jgi:uncharacterized protein YegP (UPF0339 family)